MRRRPVVVISVLPAALLLAATTAAPAQADQAHDIAVARRLGTEIRSAWQVTRGKGAKVAVLSSGVDTRVRTLTGRVTAAPDLYKGHPKRLDGTVLASLIAGGGPTTDSPFGVRGLAPAARILSIRIQPDHGEPGVRTLDIRPWLRMLAKSIRYAADHGANVILVDAADYGGIKDFGGDIRPAVHHALVKGAVVVAPSYAAAVASTPGVIGVAGLALSGRDMRRQSARNSSVLVGAPGVQAAATGPGNKPYLIWGAWAAAAWVSGTAALVKAEHPGLPAAKVAQAIALSAHHAKGGYNVRTGFGMVNPAGALRMATKLEQENASASAPAVADRTHFGGGAQPIEVVRHDTGILAASLGGTLAGLLALGLALRLALRGRRRPRATPLAVAPLFSPPVYWSPNGSHQYGPHPYGIGPYDTIDTIDSEGPWPTWRPPGAPRRGPESWYAD